MDRELSIRMIGLLDVFDLLTAGSIEMMETVLVVAKLPLQHIPDLPHLQLAEEQSYHLAELLVAVAGIPEYTPTAFNRPIALRLDVMLSRLAEQPQAFVHPLLRKWCEWFALRPSPVFNDAWLGFVAEHGVHAPQAPGMFNSLIERKLACADAEYLYLPMPVVYALATSTEAATWDELPGLLHQIRSVLLRSRPTTIGIDTYRQITAFLRASHPSMDSHGYHTARARGALVDLVRCDCSSSILSPVVDAVLVALLGLYQMDPERYQTIFNRVHGRLWAELDHAIEQLTRVESRISPSSLIIDRTNYADSCRLVSQQLRLIAEAYSILTELETTLGVDRYLSARTLHDDLSLIHERVRSTGRKIQKSLEGSNSVFFRQWNIANIASIILHLLSLSDDSHTLTSYFPNDRQRVIFLLIDALGVTQFHWFLSSVARRTSAPLAGNIFAWLQSCGAYNDSFLLASNLVGITGGCLPTIYTGALPRQTGIIGSRMMLEGHEVNVLSGIDEQHHLTDQEVADLYQRNVNPELAPFAQLAHQSGVDVCVFHAGDMRFRPLADLTYGRLGSSGRVHRVSPADRLMAEALSSVVTWRENPSKKHLALLYYPLIDHSGHGCGPYTQFQSAELAKLNFIFTHFLVDLVNRAQELFDGHTSVVITADHGMFESSTTAVSHHTIREALGGRSTCRGMRFVYDNRAMYIYGAGDANIEPIRQKLATFFDQQNLPIVVRTRNDQLVVDLLYDPSRSWASNFPDLILQFYGPGVFYHKEEVSPHMFFYGAHGGANVEEVYVPLIHFTLTPSLADSLKRLF